MLGVLRRSLDLADSFVKFGWLRSDRSGIPGIAGENSVGSLPPWIATLQTPVDASSTFCHLFLLHCSVTLELCLLWQCHWLV